MITIPCRNCGSEGRIYCGSYEDERDLGPCPDCEGTGGEMIEGEPVTEAEIMDGPCSLGVGCDEAGVCYADAHGQPEKCGRKGQ